MAEVPSLGRRGGGWVAIQFALIAAIVLAAALGPPWPETVRVAVAVAGGVLALSGIALGFAAGRALGAGLTPFPRPARAGELVERGPYGVVRHPLYSAGALVLAGVSAIFSPVALLLTAVLVVVWALKSVVEERFLADRYPGYEDYRRRVRHRLVPFVY